MEGVSVTCRIGQVFQSTEGSGLVVAFHHCDCSRYQIMSTSNLGNKHRFNCCVQITIRNSGAAKPGQRLCNLRRGLSNADLEQEVSS